jgi:hypothetical protein
VRGVFFEYDLCRDYLNFTPDIYTNVAHRGSGLMF